MHGNDWIHYLSPATSAKRWLELQDDVLSKLLPKPLWVLEKQSYLEMLDAQLFGDVPTRVIQKPKDDIEK